MKTLSSFLLTFLTILTLSSCLKDEVKVEYRAYTHDDFEVLSKSLNLPEELHDYTLEMPDHLGGSVVDSDSRLATLGRVLFYDKRLSANNTVSCASCHDPAKAFADDKAKSEGFDGELTKRNSLALAAFPSFNAYYGGSTPARMFWDERARDVQKQSILTLEDPIEMGMDLDKLADKLMKEDYYQVLYEMAFPERYELNKYEILLAIDAFVSSIGAFQSRFDREMVHHSIDDPFDGFTEEENLGKGIFLRNCNSCHNLENPSQTSFTVANNGLDLVSEDKGVGGITGYANGMGVFKVPMLRNVALTAPYMHDGRFETLEEVVEHYNSGVQAHENLHWLLIKNGQPKLLNHPEHFQKALVAFLHTLTDVESITHERFIDPFK